MRQRYKCPSCGCDVACRIWTNKDFGEYLVACVKCDAKPEERK